ncbi:uncharacterized protein E5676_scaffold692G00350 [Cucumis melo var. makuwa]|uniref:Reverse transcriptase n=1 Tax=Cucumis melo var. makuwa TaxID=1194695 RepID=A0A5D3CWB0_CUCMM|nr:uncharacterized protein E6C27_scaffold749G00360 [Cucumis melo var. makuwa]TYK14706.1 uncharacterized protein E5676_scaffold692G00350 [Cucumis melo var. makuwa]
MRLIMRWGCAPTEWAPDRIRKSKIECSRKEVYCVRKRNARSSTLFEGLETIPTRWQEFLAEFDFEFEHKKGSSNQAADALSRKQEHAAICPLAHLWGSEIGGSIRDTLR